MKIDVKKVATLSNLTLTPEEESEFESQLSNIVNYIEKLNSVDTNNVAPTAQVTGLTNQLREDKELDVCLTQEEAISQAKNQHNGLFVVSKLVDTNN